MSCSTIKMPKASLPTCKGVAAIEFSLVFLIIFVIFYGLVTFADVFFKMQAVSRAAEDGARLAQRLMVGNAVTLSNVQKDSVVALVQESLAQSSFTPGANLAERLTWVRANSVVVRSSLDSRIVELRFEYGKNRLLPYIPMADMSSWLLKNDSVITVKSAWLSLIHI